jgi:hypothetical protein
VLRDKKREMQELLTGLGAREIALEHTSRRGTLRFKGTSPRITRRPLLCSPSHRHHTPHTPHAHVARACRLRVEAKTKGPGELHRRGQGRRAEARAAHDSSRCRPSAFSRVSACCMCAVSDVIPRHVCRARGGGTTWSRRGRPARRSGGGPWRARSVGCR